uniref:C2H2-type domain-containing protein n=1 Tax=Glossina brevipalpis TaxID=37001 RepID=A0A1A9WM68_9MUSC
MEDIANISLSVPESTQSEDKQILCSYCPRIFMRRDNYFRHLITAHSDEAEITSEDREMAKAKDDYRNYNKALCQICGKFMSISTISSHLRRHTGENPYKCVVCLKGFPRSHDLLVHGRKHTNEKHYVCSVCAYALVVEWFEDLIQHLLQIINGAANVLKLKGEN